MGERRRAERQPMDATVEVVTRERTDRIVMRDYSEAGALLSGHAKYEVGERVLVRFVDGSQEYATGEVVRVTLDDDFERVTAVRFDAVQ